jgi:hypothetical protein
VVLSDDVAFFVAKHLRSNVRELEGALRKILAYSRFHGKDITIDVVKEALKDLLSVQNRQISVENIQKTVADFFNIKVADMYSKKRPANIARPRQIAMYLAKELTQKSLPEIGDLFGGATTPPCCTRCARSPPTAPRAGMQPRTARAGANPEGLIRPATRKRLWISMPPASSVNRAAFLSTGNAKTTVNLVKIACG